MPDEEIDLRANGRKMPGTWAVALRALCSRKGNPIMSVFLLILKVMGAVTSGIAALVALFRSKSFEEIKIPSLIIGGETRTEKRITREGRISACLVIAGILLSVLAQTVEQSLNNKRNEASRKATTTQLQSTEEQIHLARESLSRLGGQAHQSSTILSNVVQQQILAEKALDELSSQSERARLQLEQLREQTRLALESKERGEQQIEAARLSLRYIERLLTPIESFDLVVLYEVPTNNLFISAILSNTAQTSIVLSQVYADRIPSLAALSPSAPRALFRLSGHQAALPSGLRIQAEGDTEVRPFFRFAPRERSSFSPIELMTVGIASYESIEGPAELPIGIQGNQFSLGKYDLPGVRHQVAGTNLEMRLDLFSLTNEVWRPAAQCFGNRSSSWQKWKEMVAVFSNPNISFEVQRAKNSGNFNPDLTFTNALPKSASLVFLPSTGKLSLELHFASENAWWSKTKSLRSLPDLANSRLHIYSRIPAEIGIHHMKCLRQLDLCFYASDVVLTNFNAIQGLNDDWAGTTIPPRESFLSRDGYR